MKESIAKCLIKLQIMNVTQKKIIKQQTKYKEL